MRGMAKKYVATADAVIDELGGTYAVARLLGYDPRRVSNWRVRGLPADTFDALNKALKVKRIEAAPSLWRQRQLTDSV